jgi:LmbE family N-acetylglucosaminyl deacetylase
MILVCVAHSDDETLGAGGLIATLAKTTDVRVVTFTDGVSSRGTSADARRRADDFQNACKVLGAEGHTIEGDWPDNALDTRPRLLLAKEIEYVCGERRPDAIYTHSLSDLNIDHRRVAEAVLLATRPGGRYPVPDVYAMEVPSSTEWSFGQIEPRFTPNVFVNITGALDQKLKALSCYSAEVRESPHPRSVAMLRARAAYWGMVAGYPSAEAFQLIRSLR